MPESGLHGIPPEYCYGPAQLLHVEQTDNSMSLSLRDGFGKRARAYYSGCIYWQLGKEAVGTRLTLVRMVTAAQLLKTPYSHCLVLLRPNSDDIQALLHEWEEEGYRFYLHSTEAKDLEYLVVAQDLEYRD